MTKMSAYHIINLKEKPETSRIGEKWTIEEEEKFIRLIALGKSIEEIAKEHQRTVGGMKSRIRHMAVNMLKSKSMKEVCNLLQITQEDIELYQKRRLENRHTKEDIIEILNDIRRKLEIIESKLAYSSQYTTH